MIRAFIFTCHGKPGSIRLLFYHCSSERIFQALVSSHYKKWSLPIRVPPLTSAEGKSSYMGVGREHPIHRHWWQGKLHENLLLQFYWGLAPLVKLEDAIQIQTTLYFNSKPSQSSLSLTEAAQFPARTPEDEPTTSTSPSSSSWLIHSSLGSPCHSPKTPASPHLLCLNLGTYRTHCLTSFRPLLKFHLLNWGSLWPAYLKITTHLPIQHSLLICLQHISPKIIYISFAFHL